MSFKQCTRLYLQFPAKYFPGKASNFHLFDAKQSCITPACRVEPQPGSAGDVTAILRILVEERCHFAIKSGDMLGAQGAAILIEA